MPLRVNGIDITQLFVDNRECKVLVVNSMQCFGKRYRLAASGGVINSSVTVRRINSPNQHAPTGIVTGSDIYEGDVLEMSVAPNVDHVYAELYADISNGEGERKRQSPFTFTVCGDVGYRSTARSAILFEGEQAFGYYISSPYPVSGMTADMKIAISGRVIFSETVSAQGTSSNRREIVYASNVALPTVVSDNGAGVQITHEGDKLWFRYMPWQGVVKGINTFIMPTAFTLTQVRIIE